MNIIDWVLYIPLTLCVCYLLLYAIASKFYRAPQYPEARTLRHIAVLFPAYKEDRVILSSVRSFLEQDYPKELFDLVVISDQMQPETNEALRTLPIRLLMADYTESSKAKALAMAMNNIDTDLYDIVVIMDADNVTVPEVLSCITEIRKNLEKVEIQGSEVHRNVYVSDRRWKNIVKLLKASAFIHGRKEVCLTDLLPVYHCLWNEPEECADIRQIVVRALFVPYVKEIVAINLSLKSDLKVSRVREALEKARQKGDRRDDDLMIIDHFYYQIENHGTGNTYIFIVDYKNLKEYSPKDVPATGVMYADPLNPKRTIIRTFSDATKMKEQGAERVTLYRDEKNLYINGVRFPMRRLKRGEQQQLWLGNMTLTDRDYETELETAHDRIEKLVKDLSENIFISEEDKKGVAQYVATLRKEIAWARVDVRKLRYGDES